MAGIFPDSMFDPSAYGGGGSGGVLPPWLAQVIEGLQSGPSRLQSFSPAQLPLVPGTYPTGSPIAAGAPGEGDAGPPMGAPASAMPSALGPIPQLPSPSSLLSIGPAAAQAAPRTQQLPMP